MFLRYAILPPPAVLACGSAAGACLIVLQSPQNPCLQEEARFATEERRAERTGRVKAEAG